MPKNKKKNEYVMRGTGRGEDAGKVPFLTTAAKTATERTCQLLSDGKWHDNFKLMHELCNEISYEYFMRLRCIYPDTEDQIFPRRRWFFSKLMKHMENKRYIERTNPNGFSVVSGPYKVRITDNGRTKFLL